MKFEQTPEHVWLFWYRASTLLANSIAERTCSDVDTRRDSLRKKSPSMELPKRHHQNKVDGLHALRRKPFGRRGLSRCGNSSRSLWNSIRTI